MWRGRHGQTQLAVGGWATSRGMSLGLNPSCSRSGGPGTGGRALRRTMVVRSTGGEANRVGTLEGIKAHGWIGCAASETAAVHYGLVSGVKPCSWAASSGTSLLRHLATGGAGARGQRPIPGGALLAAHPRNPEARCSRPGSNLVVSSSDEGAMGSSISCSLL